MTITEYVKGTGAEVRPTIIVSGIVIGDGQLLANFFSVSLVTVPEIVAKVHPVQVPSRLIVYCKMF